MEINNMSNIVLIGMPSCGKSTIGVLLAKNLGMSFLDTDLLIQEETGKLLHELISELGNEGFLKLENKILSSLKAENSVIATGGSAIYADDGMKHLKSLGKTVYLKISYETLCERLGDYTHRGVVIRSGSTLLDMYSERSPLYEINADFTLNVNKNASLHDTTKRLTELCLN